MNEQQFAEIIAALSRIADAIEESNRISTEALDLTKRVVLGSPRSVPTTNPYRGDIKPLTKAMIESDSVRLTGVESDET